MPTSETRKADDLAQMLDEMEEIRNIVALVVAAQRVLDKFHNRKLSSETVHLLLDLEREIDIFTARACSLREKVKS